MVCECAVRVRSRGSRALEGRGGAARRSCAVCTSTVTFPLRSALSLPLAFDDAPHEHNKRTMHPYLAHARALVTFAS